MDPLLLDVNVHPTKQQIRISSEDELGELIKKALHDTMYQEVRIPGSYSEDIAPPPVQPRAEKPTQMNFEFQPAKEPQRSYDSARNWMPQTNRPQSDGTHVDESEAPPVPTHEMSDDESALRLAETAERKNYHEEATEQFPELDYIGQLHGTYLLTQNEDGLYFIDQHAAQERIKYEYYKALLSEEADAMQELLVPIVLEYPSDEVMVISENLETLADAGVSLESFGQNSFIVREHPTWILPGQEQSTIEEMIAFFLERKNLTVGLFREATAIMMSCKRSIKANHRLSDAEAVALIEQLPMCENPYNCPHGRPVLVKLTSYDLEKMFKRIQDRH